MGTQVKEFWTRVAQKHDTEINWQKVEENFIPLAGEIIVYDADGTYNYPRIKIGNGVYNTETEKVEGTVLKDLKFLDDGAIAEMANAIKSLSLIADGTTKTGIAYNGTLIPNSSITVPYATEAASAGTAGVAGRVSNKLYFGESTDYYDGSAEKTIHTLTVGDKKYNGSADITIELADLGLDKAMKFLGTSDISISDGGTEKPTIGGKEITPVAGDIVIYDNKEFIFTSAGIWELFGDEGSYVSQAVYNAFKKTLNYEDTAVAKQFVTEVDQKDGVISVTRSPLALEAEDIPQHRFDDGGNAVESYIGDTSYFGHVKLSDETSQILGTEGDQKGKDITPGAAEGVGASRKAVAAVKKALDDKIAADNALPFHQVEVNDVDNWVLFNCGTSTTVIENNLT